ERGAVVVLDQRAIFVASQSIDVTDVLIDRINSEVGPGPLAEEPETDAVEPTEPAPEDGPEQGLSEQPGPGGAEPAMPGTPPGPADE
ncbi:OmpH family outer membrane protein, partial [Paracoccus sp. PXZ]